MLEKITRHIEDNLNAFIKKASRHYGFSHVSPFLDKSLIEYTQRKGKRIRPALFILSYQGYLAKGQRTHASLYAVATAIEFLHNFMLVHDDIIDNSDLRRGQPALHKILRQTIKSADPLETGNNLGIIAGDILFALAIESFLSVKENPKRKEKALKYFLETTTMTALGEFIDTVHGLEKLERVKEKDVYLNYTLKTARYTFENPLVLGALLAGAPPEEIKKLSAFGRLCGQAFQIQDDMIGLFDSEKNIGKSLLSDLSESKKTLLVVYAWRHLNREDKKRFKNIFEKKKKTYGDLLAVRKLLVKSGSFDHAQEEIKSRAEKALILLDSIRMKKTVKQVIYSLIDKFFAPSRRLEEKYKEI